MTWPKDKGTNMTGQGLESRSLASMTRPVWTLQYCFAKYPGKKVAPDTQIWNPVKFIVGVNSYILAKTASSSLLFLGCVLHLHSLGPSIQSLVPFLVTSFCCSFFLRVFFPPLFVLVLIFFFHSICISGDLSLNWHFRFYQTSHFEGWHLFF